MVVVKMKIVLFGIFLVFSAFSVFASGRKEVPQNYIDIEDLDLTKNQKYAAVYLPYTKPAGFTKIIYSTVIGLIIDELIADGTECRPRRPLWDAGAYEAITRSYEEDVELEEGTFTMPMTWGGSPLSEGIGFRYHTKGEKINYSPTKYRIPYRSKEVYITYRIRFPDYSKESDFKNYIIRVEGLIPSARSRVRALGRS